MIDQTLHLQVDSLITEIWWQPGVFFIKRTNTLQILHPSQLTPTIPPLRKPRSERYSENSPYGPPHPEIPTRESPLPVKTERKTSLLYNPIQEISKKVRKEKGVSHPTKERSMSRNSSLPADGRGRGWKV
ncbi:hypothetical protein QR685DRAFT_575810 [Neurospora intermedia]|uniref:Uncharacterized protein n=1 Tax=Neurospora intermedia TaxID=5142 RepID=A0ABR3CZ85_NEUIN